MNVTAINHRFISSRKRLSSSSLTSETVNCDDSVSLNSLEEGRGCGDYAALNKPLLMETPAAMSRTWMDFILEPTISKGRFSVPLQSEARPWLKYLILLPMCTFSYMLFFSYYWAPLLVKNGALQFFENLLRMNQFTMLLLGALVALGVACDVIADITTGIMLLRGRRRRHLPDHIPRLTHAVIVCNYKEPLETLRATIQSIADNTLADNTIVVLACEERDPTANSTFQCLDQEFASSFCAFFKTSHKLAEGEIIGKSSNENFACQELFKFVQQQGMDPFQVMVTTCDADSLFDRVFFEQVEAEYCRMPDGRRFIYNSPINTYRNLPECNGLVRAFEVLRCQFDTFNGMTGFRPAQSNYSLTLGFAHEMNFWDPSNTSEDFHTTLKAMAMTGLGESVVVKVWSLILNDSVTGFQDRWIQAKRHMWGIEEAAFVASLFPVIRLNQWLVMFGRVCSQMFGVCIPLFLYFLFRPIRDIFFALGPETQYLIVGSYLAVTLYNWVKMIIRELFLYRYILSGRSLMMKRSLGEWLQLIFFWPVMVQVASIIFATCATWRMLIHAVFHETLTYVTAPKALNTLTVTHANDTGDVKPKKGI
ncbi:expressed unknown protein [Seminavis robusta]|uniref:Glycosyltransferase 2-like domain-containing protein n=1 Tax=Seminavis robusta TaxID=568900 RepID=A0A9N8DXF2_9STRA|nr:expressed unknown protein [Seminavis robusta]|eukprot:Sro428_g140770.1 n/a (593) ;mRNA; r:3689-5467